MTTTLPWHPTLPSKSHRLTHKRIPPPKYTSFRVQAFRKSDLDGFAEKIASGELWRDIWRGANNGFEQFVYESKKTAERIDRRYEVSRKVSEVARVAGEKARLIDRELEVTQKWRSFSIDFATNLPRYRKQLSDFLDTPIGRSFATIFFLWFALSGWLFRILIIATWVLPFAGPLLIGAVANNFVIKGSCPSCKRQFVGAKNQIVRCAGCGNIVWQPQGDFFSKGGGKASKSDPNIIDVEFEEK